MVEIPTNHMCPECPKSEELINLYLDVPITQSPIQPIGGHVTKKPTESHYATSQDCIAVYINGMFFIFFCLDKDDVLDMDGNYLIECKR